MQACDASLRDELRRTEIQSTSNGCIEMRLHTESDQKYGDGEYHKLDHNKRKNLHENLLRHPYFWSDCHSTSFPHRPGQPEASGRHRRPERSMLKFSLRKKLRSF